MDAQYTIRLAQPADLPQLGAIERTAAVLFAQAGWDDSLLDDCTPLDDLAAAQAESRLWVAVDATNQPVGLALAAIAAGSAHLCELDVHPDHMRRGIGRALIETVCDWARAARHRTLTLTTESDLAWNAPYYARLGFTMVPLDQLTPAQRALFDTESEGSPDPSARVFMRRRLNP